MSFPLRWASGDRCAFRRPDGMVRIGRILAVGDGVATVVFEGSRLGPVTLPTASLDLVPFARSNGDDPGGGVIPFFVRRWDIVLRDAWPAADSNCAGGQR